MLRKEALTSRSIPPSMTPQKRTIAPSAAAIPATTPRAAQPTGPVTIPANTNGPINPAPSTTPIPETARTKSLMKLLALRLWHRVLAKYYN